MITSSHRLLLQRLPAAVPCESQPLPEPADGASLASTTGSNSTTTYMSTATASAPVLGVALVVLFATFFLIAFLSIYVRRLAIARLATDNASILDNYNGRTAGLDRATISNLPTIVFHSIVNSMTAKDAAGKSPTKDPPAAPETEPSPPVQWSPLQHHSDYDLYECAVCLSAFEEGEVLRMLPVCRHCFHPECIDMWLFSHSTCPLCRSSELLLNPGKPANASTTAAAAASSDSNSGHFTTISVLQLPSSRQ